MLCFQLCFFCYTALQTKNSTRSISTINPVTTKILAISMIANTATGKLHHAIMNRDLALSDWNTKEDKGKSMMRVLYVLRLAKRHILRQSDIEQ